MNKQLLAMLNETEQALLREINDGDISALGEDALIELHTRVRRARTKYSKLYRRRSAANVQTDKGRAKASATHQRTARKAEIFEDALAKVSRQLARVARASANDLKQERLAAATRANKPAPKNSARRSQPVSLPDAKRKQRTGASKRASAQNRAANRRSEAKRAAKR